MEKLTLIKVGGKIVEETDTLNSLLDDFVRLCGAKVLVHGGGRRFGQQTNSCRIATTRS